MLDNLLNKLFRNNHTVPAVDDEGRLTAVQVTCVEMQGHLGTHTAYETIEVDGVVTHRLVVLSCAEAEAERQGLLIDKVTQAELVRAQHDRIGTLEAEAEAKDETIANYERLMTQSLPVIFRLGPSLQDVLAEALSHPDMTDDGTAVQLKATQFTLILLPKQERVLLRAVGVNVPECSFPIVNGTVSTNDQTMMLGQISRIKRTHETGVDPVGGMIDVVRQSAAEVAVA